MMDSDALDVIKDAVDGMPDVFTKLGVIEWLRSEAKRKRELAVEKHNESVQLARDADLADSLADEAERRAKHSCASD